MAEPEKILIIRLSAIGDIVFASPLIRALRRRYPQASISWLVEPAAAPLLQQNPGLDRVILWPKSRWQAWWQQRRWLTLWRAYRDFRRQLKAEQYDWVIDLQGLLKSGWLAYMTSAPRRTGLGSKEGSGYLMTQVLPRNNAGTRISSEYFTLARDLGLDVSSFEMDLALSPEDGDYGRNFRQNHGDYAVIAPFTTRPQKHWREERWPLLAGALKKQGLAVVMLGGPTDQDAAARIAAANNEIINLAGKTSLGQSAALISCAAALIGVDTGLTHMGIAFNVPTVALFGSTCPYLETGRANVRIIYHQLDCSPCRRNPTCDGRFDCMVAISVDEVMTAVQQTLPVTSA